MSEIEVGEGQFNLSFEGVPCASRTYWFKCDQCDQLHVVLERENGELIATMVVDLDMLTSMVEVVQGPPTATRNIVQ